MNDLIPEIDVSLRVKLAPEMKSLSDRGEIILFVSPEAKIADVIDQLAFELSRLEPEAVVADQLKVLVQSMVLSNEQKILGRTDQVGNFRSLTLVPAPKSSLS